MAQQICFGFVYLAEGLIAWQLFEALLPRKRKLGICVSMYALCYLAAFLMYQIAGQLLNVVAFLLGNVVILFVCYRCSWGTALFYSAIVSGMMMVTEWLVAFLLFQITGQYGSFFQSVPQLVVMVVISKLLYFLCVRIYLMLSKRRQGTGKLPPMVAAVLIGFSFLSLAVIFTVFLLGSSTEDLSWMEQLWIMVSSVGLLLANILLYFAYQYVQSINQRYTALLLQQQKDRASTQYYTALQDQYDRQRVLIHDMRHHLETIKGLAGEENSRAVQKYVAEMEKLPELQRRVRFCSDPVLNAILFRCSEACTEKGITFTSDIRYCNLDDMSSIDKTALFGNLLENAVEAAAGVENAFVELTLDYRQPPGILVVALQNSCRTAPVLDEEGTLRSRKEGDGHGLGMKSVSLLVKKYGGELLWQWDNAQQSFKVTLTLPVSNP